MEELLLLKEKSMFERIKHVDEEGKEYWNARELMKALGYAQWRNFKVAIEKAKEACKILY